MSLNKVPARNGTIRQNSPRPKFTPELRVELLADYQKRLLRKPSEANASDILFDVAHEWGRDLRTIERNLEKAREEEAMREQAARIEAARLSAVTNVHAAALSRHHQSLIYLGQRIRERLSLDMAPAFIDQEPVAGSLLMWSGREREGLVPVVFRDPDEEAVERDWAPDRFDARSHPLFNSFARHLENSLLQSSLDAVQRVYVKYIEACRKAHSMIVIAVGESLPGLIDIHAAQAAASLLYDLWRRKSPPIPLCRVEPDERGLNKVRLFFMDVGPLETADAERVKQCYERLTADLRSSPFVRTMKDSQREAEVAMDNLRKMLSPEDRLRSLVMGGRCSDCLAP